MLFRSPFVFLLFSLASAVGLAQQTWQFTDSLHQARRIPALAVLDDGRVLATGGYLPSSVPTAECELYDPSTATWSIAESMLQPRARHSIVKLQDGTVLAVAGQVEGTDYVGTRATATVERYIPASGHWIPAGSLLTARQNQTATLLPDSTILVVGGWSTDVGTVLSSCEIFDPRTGISRQVASMLQARHDHQAILLNTGDVLVAGGRTGGQYSEYLAEVELYSPSADTWTRLAPMLQARIIGTLVQFSDGSVLAAGGHNSPTTSARGSELLDPSTLTWSETDSMRQPCHWQGEAWLGNDRYMITGGIVDADWATSTTVSATATCEWYDKAKSRWYYAPLLNQSRSEHGTVHVFQFANPELPEEFVLVAGGLADSATFTRSCEVLDVGIAALRAYMASPANLSAVSEPASAQVPVIDVIANGSPAPVIRYALRSTYPATLSVYTVAGKFLARLPLAGMSAGALSVEALGAPLTSGTYVVRVSQAGLSGSARFVVAR